MKKKPLPTFDPDEVQVLIGKVSEITEASSKYGLGLDLLGDVEKYAEGTPERALAFNRDQADFALTPISRNLFPEIRLRAETTRCQDLLLEVAFQLMGDGAEALRLMRLYHAMHGNEAFDDGTVGSETFPDLFSWDAYQRVSALSGLAIQFPQHIRHSAASMHGWPMIVTHHLNVVPEFERIASLLGIGTKHPLDVSPRAKRGSETPLLNYLEPIIWRVDALRIFLVSTLTARGHEDFSKRIRGILWQYPDQPPDPETLKILDQVPNLPPLTQHSANQWSKDILVPLILLGDAKTHETCTVPPLANIWKHRAVKSPATFRSRLHSVVCDVLRRYSKQPK